MKIGIDARFVGPQGTGLGKYTEKLIQNLVAIDNQNQYVIFLKKANWDYLPLPRHSNFKKVETDISWYSLKEQLKLPKIFQSQNLDILHVPHFNVPILYKKKFIVTIHDLIHHQFRQQAVTTNNPLLFNLKRLGYKKVISHAVKKSTKIIVPSNHVKEEIIKNFRVSPSKIIVTYEAAEEEYFNRQPCLAGRQASTVNRQPLLVYVGNAYPHKNLESLLQAFKILVSSPQNSSQLSVNSSQTRQNSEVSINRERITENRLSVNPALPAGRRQPSTVNLKLILVCPRDIFWQRLQDEIKQHQLEDYVELKSYLKPTELAKLFHKAIAYVFPSQSEGFGIPGLNAMAAGLPVICSNIPTLKEIYGDAAVYFDPQNPEDIAQKICQILQDNKIRSGLIEKGKKQVQKYSWRRMAEQTLATYQQAAK